MNSYFWTNTIWYLALFATSVAAFAIIFTKTGQRKKMFAFWFAVLGFTYCIEVTLLLLFNAYTYYPMIQPKEPFFDAVLGNIFSQVSVSSSAVLLCVLGLSNWWLAGFSAAYFLIDVLFVQLGIYEHFWYRSVFTLAGFFMYGLIIKYWYKRIFSVPPKWLYTPTLFLSAWSVTANLAGTLIKFIGLREFRFDLTSDPSRNHTATAIIYGLVMVTIMMALNRMRPVWWQRLFVLLLLLGCQYSLLLSGIMAVRPGWEIIIMLFDIAVFYGWTVCMDRFLRSGLNTRRPEGE